MHAKILKHSLFTITLLAVFGVLSFLAFSPHEFPVYAQSSEDELETKIKELEEKIKELSTVEQSLTKEISYLDSQISLTELKIQKTNADISEKTNQIEKLKVDISDLGDRMDKISGTIDLQGEILAKRSRARYESVETSPIYIIFGGDGISGVLKKLEYLRTMSEEDQKLLTQMKETKQIYDKQRDMLGDKKEKIEQLKKQIEQEKQNLVVYSSQLETKKIEKNNLLEDTKEDEATYQKLLSQAKAELDAINGIVSGISFSNGEKVKKGDLIAYMGNSGAPYCSTGAHLHLEIRKNGAIVNAESYLKPKTLMVYHYSSGNTKIGSGSWDWPMEDPIITQRYGKTPWSWRYPNSFHTGIDMVDSGNYEIRAPADGVYIRSVQNCYGVGLNYAAIDHGNGVVSYFLHIR